MKTWQRFSVVLILIFGFLLKLHNYDVYPQRGATSDEYTYSFLGLSLLTKGIPISWSHFGVYKNREDVRINAIDFPLVQPYFDHPPLFGLFVGGWSLTNGEDNFKNITLSTIRLVPIALSVITSALVFLLTYRLTDYMTAMWALLIYSTVTIFVIQSRVVFAENLLAPIFLGAMYFFHHTVKKMRIYHAVLLGFLSAAAFWTKESGITVALVLFILFLQKKIKKPCVLAFVGTALLGIFGYAAYGWVFDWETFTKIITLQGTRDVGPQTFWYLLSTPIIVNKIYYDGWYYFGFFALAYLLADMKRYAVLLVPSFIYFLFLLFSLTQEGQSGWYMIPLFPFMAIASAIALRETPQKATGAYIVFLLFIGLTLMSSLFAKLFGLTSIQFRWLFIIVFVPYLVSFFLEKTQWVRLLHSFYFYVAIVLAVYTTLTYIHPA